MDTNDKTIDNQEATSTSDNETMESWTFLEDDSANATYNRNDIDNKIPNSFSSISENLLNVSNAPNDGDISDGISVISDYDSDGHSPIPLQSQLNDDIEQIACDNVPKNMLLSSQVEDIEQYTLVRPSNDMQTCIDQNPRHLWNPINMLLFGLIIGAAAILSSRYLGLKSYEDLVPEMSSLLKRIQDLENENLALKFEVNRLIELYSHAGHEKQSIFEQANDRMNDNERPIKFKKVWTGNDDKPTHIPKYTEKRDYCNDDNLASDDLFDEYNAEKCDEQTKKMTNSGEMKKKKNLTKDDTKRHLSDNSNNKYNLRKTDSFIDDDTIDEDFSKLYEQHKSIIEANRKYNEQINKLEKKQSKDKGKRYNLRKKRMNDMDNVNGDWYDKRMKMREEQRSNESKHTNKENWYADRSEERENLRNKRKRQFKKIYV